MKVAFAIFILIVAASSTPVQTARAKKPKMKLTFLTREGCPNTPKVRANLDAAIKKLKLPVKYEVLDIGKLPKNDARTGYGTPTVLLNGKDLFGLPIPKKSSAPR